MNQLLFLLLFVLVFCEQSASAQSLQWAAYGHGPQLNASQRIATDNNGNTIIAGKFSGSLSFGIHSQTGPEGSNFIAKYDASGNPLWVKQISANGHATCTGLATDSVGNIYAAGYFDAPITIDTINLPLSGQNSFFIVKYSTDGEALWAVSAGNIFYLKTSLSVDKAGNAYFCGSFNGTLTLGNHVFQTPVYNIYSFIVKYDSNGLLSWAKQITYSSATSEPATGAATRIYSSGDFVFVAGEYGEGTAFFDTVMLTSQGFGEIYLVKYDPVGNVQWGKTMGSSLAEEYINEMVTDPIGNLYFTGHSFSGFNIDTATTGYQSGSVAYAVKLNSAGQLKWIWHPNKHQPGQSYLNDGESRSYGISLDFTGRIIVAGYFDSDFRLPGFATLSTQYYNNLFVLALDSANGNPLAAFQDGGTVGEVAAYGMALHPDGSVMVTGAFGPGISLQNGPTVMSQGSADVFLAKYSSLVTAAPEPVSAGSLALSVHPNPATGTVQVSGKSKTSGKTVFTLRDLTGRTILQTQADLASGAFSKQLDVMRLNAGMYLLQVQTGELSQTLRLVKQ